MAKSSKRDIQAYTHTGQQRVNNPPVGLVTPRTDQDADARCYAHDPHLDPQLSMKLSRFSGQYTIWELMRRVGVSLETRGVQIGKRMPEHITPGGPFEKALKQWRKEAKRRGLARSKVRR